MPDKAGSVPCIPRERLLAVAVADNLLFTSGEFDHLKTCRDCFETWAKCIADAGLRIREHEEHDKGMVDDGGSS
jgi:hypothetical protein